MPAAALSTKYKLSKEAIIYITHDESNVAKYLSDEFEQHGFQVSVVDQLPENASQVVLLAGLKNVSNRDEAIAINQQCFLHFKQIAANISKAGGSVITVQDTGGYFGLKNNPGMRAWLAGITGLVKTAALEWPNVRLKAIDIEQLGLTPDVIAKRIASEVLFGDNEIEIGLPYNEKRIKLQITPAARQISTHSKQTNPLLLVSGGARGITAACLIEYAKNNPARFILLGRTHLTDEDLPYKEVKDKDNLRKVLIQESRNADNVSPKIIENKLQKILAIREIKSTLQTLKQLGSEASYISVDIQNQQQVTQVVAEVRAQHGHVDGIIHAAGVLADKLIVDKTTKQFQDVFDTKVIGLKNILVATAQDPLSLIIAFSSVSARFGNKGQADYAMANEILNKVMQAEKVARGAECLVKSINWGAWDSGMVNPSLKKVFEERGIKLISKEVGAKLFASELMDHGQQVEIVLGQPLQKTKVQTEITVNAVADTYMQSHVLYNNPIVPAVLGFEWLLWHLNKQKVNLCDYQYTDFKILKGITLTQFPTDDYHFSVQQDAANIVLKNKENSHFMVSVNQKSSEEDNHLFNIETVLENSTSWPFTNDQLYDGLLFHGPHFHAIDSLEQFSNQGGSAMLSGMLSEKKWPHENWCTDVVLFDGIMQVAGLWCFIQNNHFVMPTGIGAIKLYQSGVIKEKVYCVVECKTINKSKVLINAVCLDAQNKKIVEMRDIMMIAFG